MTDALIPAATLGAGVLLGGGGVWLATRGQTANAGFQAEEAGRATLAQVEAMVLAAQNALLSTAAQSGRDTGEALVAQAKREIDPLLEPMRKSVEALVAQVQTADRDRAAGYAALVASIGGVNDVSLRLGDAANRMSGETRALVGALRNNQSRGVWGEVALRNLVEQAGLTPWCDFVEQTAGSTGVEGRPDMTVRLPGSQVAFLDAKAPMSAYLSYAEEADERRAAELRRDHARAVRLHVDALSRRAYHATPGSIPYTLLFLPIESLLWTAMTEQPDLCEYAAGKGVLLCSPLILMTVLKVFATDWRIVRQNEQAEEIARQGSELYKRFARFAGFFNEIGKALGLVNGKYNEAASSFRTRLMPQASRFHELAALDAPEAPEPVLVDAAPQTLSFAAPDEDGGTLRPPLNGAAHPAVPVRR